MTGIEKFDEEFDLVLAIPGLEAGAAVSLPVQPLSQLRQLRAESELWNQQSDSKQERPSLVGGVSLPKTSIQSRRIFAKRYRLKMLRTLNQEMAGERALLGVQASAMARETQGRLSRHLQEFADYAIARPPLGLSAGGKEVYASVVILRWPWGH
jgi:hypothetical protein